MILTIKGGNFRGWTPTPPERGSFPLDHLGECTEYMTKYLNCMKFTENRNAPNCRILAKEYLGCRMKNQLMEESDWDSLGLINLPGEKTEKHLFSPDEVTKESIPSVDSGNASISKNSTVAN